MEAERCAAGEGYRPLPKVPGTQEARSGWRQQRVTGEVGVFIFLRLQS